MVFLVSSPGSAVAALVCGALVALATFTLVYRCELWLLARMGYRRLSFEEDARIQPLLDEAARGLGVSWFDIPAVLMIDTALPDAYAHMRALVLTRGLLEQVDDPQLAGILAHELAHWQACDAVGSTLVWAAAFPLALLHAVLTWVCRNTRVGMLTGLLALVLWPVDLTIRLVIGPVAGVDRRACEYAADAAVPLRARSSVTDCARRSRCSHRWSSHGRAGRRRWCGPIHPSRCVSSGWFPRRKRGAARPSWRIGSPCARHRAPATSLSTSLSRWSGGGIHQGFQRRRGWPPRPICRTSADVPLADNEGSRDPLTGTLLGGRRPSHALWAAWRPQFARRCRAPHAPRTTADAVHRSRSDGTAPARGEQLIRRLAYDGRWSVASNGWTEREIRAQVGAMAEQIEIGVLEENGRMARRRGCLNDVLYMVPWLMSRNRRGAHIYVLRWVAAGSAGVILVMIWTPRRCGGCVPIGSYRWRWLRRVRRNHQAWIRVAAGPITTELATAVARVLARRYGGDRNSAVANHLGRLAGFTNRKERYRDAEGRYPWVRVRVVGQRVAAAAEALLEEAVAEAPAAGGGDDGAVFSAGGRG